jgi:hypothetical protein
VAAFAGGVLAAGVVSTAVPAAPEQCLPVVGCVTTTVPPVTLPGVTLPPVTVPPTPLPEVTVPPPLGTTTTPTTTTTTSGGGPGSTPAPPGSTPASAPTASPGGTMAALSAKATVRVRGRGARRVVEIRLVLSKTAAVGALLQRNGRTLALRQYAGRAGSSLLRLPVRRTTKAGPARLRLTYRTNAGETMRASYRLRLPR